MNHLSSNDSFLLKIDDSSLRIIDHALLQSTQNDEVQTFAFSNKMGLLVGGKSAGSSVYSHSSSSYTISLSYNWTNYENKQKNLQIYPQLKDPFCLRKQRSELHHFEWIVTMHGQLFLTKSHRS